MMKRELKLSVKDSVEEAYGRILAVSLEQAFAHEEVILKGEDPEGVHQMRVALRRFRSCFSVFKRVVVARVAGPVRRDIKPLLARLGPARDWDVFREKLAAMTRESMPGREDFARVEHAAGHLRDQAYAELRTLLRSREYHRTKLGLIDWVAGRTWRAGLADDELGRLAAPVVDFANGSLQRGDGRVRRRGERICGRSEDELHVLRIAAKKQRYATEFFAGLYPERRVKPYLRALKRLQTDLGHLNDGATARKLLAEIGRRSGAGASCQYVLGWIERGLGESRGQLPALWAEFGARKPFWNK